MLKITNKTINLKCNECGHVLQIKPSALNVTEDILDPDRQMGPEYEFDFMGEFQCSECCNDMQVCIKGFEYPEGAYNSQDEETYGCSIVDPVNITAILQ